MANLAHNMQNEAINSDGLIAVRCRLELNDNEFTGLTLCCCGGLTFHSNR